MKAKKAKPTKRKAIKKPVVKKKSLALKKPAAKKLVAKKSAIKKMVKKIAKKASKKSPLKAAKKPIKKVVKKTLKKIVKKAAPKKLTARKLVKKTVKKVTTKKPAPRKLATIKLAAKPEYHFEGPAAPQVKLILAALDDAKAENTIAINIAGRSAMADAMVITTGRANRHVAAIADQLITKLKSKGGKNIRVEGKEAGDWCLVDTGDVIIHIFRPEVRSFYNLEKLWSADAPKGA